MLLIVFLGLIAKIVFVSGDCNLGTPTLHNFEWSSILGPRPWYTLKHVSYDAENFVDCLRSTVSLPEGNRSLVTTEYYDKSAHVHRTFHGYATNWNSTGYYEYSYPLQTWNGVGLVIGVDNDRYYIGKYCIEGTNETSAHIYVAYRSPHPDQETVNEVNRQMQEKHVDASQFVNLATDHCPQAESSAAGGSSA